MILIITDADINAEANKFDQAIKARTINFDVKEAFLLGYSLSFDVSTKFNIMNVFKGITEAQAYYLLHKNISPKQALIDGAKKGREAVKSTIGNPVNTLKR